MEAIKTKFFSRAWEKIDGEGTTRLNIWGGWLVWSSYNPGSESMTFVPDPEHRWKLVPEISRTKDEEEETK